MKHTIKTAVTLVFISCLTLYSCKKEESIEPTSPSENNSNLNGVWIEGEWTTMTVLGIDTTYTVDYYVGDGYNNGVTTVNVEGTSYLISDTVSVSGNNYVITDFTPEGTGLDTNYRYHLEMQILSPFEGCRFHLE